MSAPQSRAFGFFFVGNSLIYRNNLPAVFDALAAANGRSVHSDMIVRGGASLADWYAEGVVGRAMAVTRYDVLVLQERGGLLAGGFGETAQIGSNIAMRSLSTLARNSGAEPLLLGTYQQVPEVSRWQPYLERRAASEAGLDNIPVSEQLQAGMRIAPRGEWIAEDEQHPGADLTLLDAVLVYRKVFGEWPEATAFRVDAPMFARSGEFMPPSPVSLPVKASEAGDGHDYSSEVLGWVLEAASHESNGEPPEPL